MYAARDNPNPDAIAILAKSGATMGHRDKNGVTPLMWAAMKNTSPDVIADAREERGTGR